MISPRLIPWTLLAALLAGSSAVTFGAEEPEHADRRQPYQAAIPDSKVTFEMVPIPGGTFRIGSPEGERGRKKDEGPQVGVAIDPFYIGKYEVTWAEYDLFLKGYHGAIETS